MVSVTSTQISNAGTTPKAPIATRWRGLRKDAEAHVALSVVLVQPSAGGDNAKRFADAEMAARRAVQLDPKNAVGWDRLGVALQARGLVNSETEHSYRRAIELDPQFAVALCAPRTRVESHESTR